MGNFKIYLKSKNEELIPTNFLSYNGKIICAGKKIPCKLVDWNKTRARNPLFETIHLASILEEITSHKGLLFIFHENCKQWYLWSTEPFVGSTSKHGFYQICSGFYYSKLIAWSQNEGFPYVLINVEEMIHSNLPNNLLKDIKDYHALKIGLPFLLEQLERKN